MILEQEEIVLNKKKSYLSKIRGYESLNKRRIIAILQEIPKQSIQRAYEHIPYTHFIDLYREKGLLSQTPIPKGSIGYKGRRAITIPQSGIVGELCLNGKKIFYEAQTNISNIFQGEIPENISIDMAIMMMSIALGTTIYWLTVKPGDAIQLRRKYRQEQENITVS